MKKPHIIPPGTVSHVGIGKIIFSFRSQGNLTRVPYYTSEPFRFLIPFLIFLLPLSLISQSITHHSIYPINPTPADIVRSVASSSFTSSGCMLITSSVSVHNDTIRIHARHQVGMGAALCYSTDTISMGKLASGPKILIRYLEENGGSTTWDTDTIRFSVSGPTALSHLGTDETLTIVPNPAHDQVTIRSKGFFDATLMDNAGREVVVSKNNVDACNMNLSLLSPGLYFITIKRGQQTFTQKIIRHWQ